MFGAATVLALLFCVAYFVVPEHATFGNWFALNTVLGVTLGLSLLLIGLGAVALWRRSARTADRAA